MQLSLFTSKWSSLTWLGSSQQLLFPTSLFSWLQLPELKTRTTVGEARQHGEPKHHAKCPTLYLTTAPCATSVHQLTAQTNEWINRWCPYESFSFTDSRQRFCSKFENFTEHINSTPWSIATPDASLKLKRLFLLFTDTFHYRRVHELGLITTLRGGVDCFIKKTVQCPHILR